MEELQNTLVLICVFLSIFFFLCGINDVIELDNQKSEERREMQREQAYKELEAKRTMKKNREALFFYATHEK